MLLSILLTSQLMVGVDNVNSMQLQENNTVQTVKVQEALMKPSAFKGIVNKTKKVQVTKRVAIDSKKGMESFVKSLYTELPSTVTVTSTKYTAKELKTMFSEVESSIIADELPNVHGLASYRTQAIGKTLRLTDNSSKQYKAKQIQEGVTQYVKVLAPSLKGKTEQETIINTYNYIFDNFTYNANGFQTMRVGNIGNASLACNGFSYLADKLLEANNIKSEIRMGESHFWNVVTLQTGEQLTFDVTSDILLKERFITLGVNTDDHIKIVSNIGFYSAKYGKIPYPYVKELPKNVWIK